MRTTVALGAALLLAGLPACKSTEPSGGGEEPDFSTASEIVKASGDAQIVSSGGAVQPLRVTVFTPTGHKCYGCTVTWTMSPGQFQGGSVISTTNVTGEAGINLINFQAGSYTITATISNNKSVAFSVTFQ
jgi:hypothetical protein